MQKQKVKIYEMNMFEFMIMDLDELEQKVHPAPDEKGK